MELIKAFFLGIIEGLTEFLPVSSTGHLILVGDWIQFEANKGHVFEVAIQLGAILAVCWYYRAKIIQLIQGVLTRDEAALRFASVVLIAFLPAAVIGVTLIGPIKHLLFDPLVVAAALIVGALIIFWVENRNIQPNTHHIDHITWKQAVGIGLAQCVAMIPGTSRSGATIIGAMLARVSRQASTEFSFFLSIPTMLGAVAYDGWKHYHLLTSRDLDAIAVGFVAAFISALLVVKALIKFVSKHSLKVFAWYRLALGSVIILVAVLGGQFSLNSF
jgi:undecaprenyl-diphosphatase